MKKVRVIVLLCVLVIALATTTVVSAAPKLGYAAPCFDTGGAPCTGCVSGYWGWFCISESWMATEAGSSIGDINYHAQGCGVNYYAPCNPEICHCMALGYTDHCYSWNH